MKAPLARVSDYVYAIMRIVTGVLFAFHGAQKVFGMFGGTAQRLDTQLGIAGVLELVLGLMVALGAYAGVAALVASGLMAAAYFIAHAPRGPLPILNQGELAMLYCFVFLYIASRGSGRLSVTRS
jgi:putative oxidoreductase